VPQHARQHGDSRVLTVTLRVDDPPITCVAARQPIWLRTLPNWLRGFDSRHPLQSRSWSNPYPRVGTGSLCSRSCGNGRSGAGEGPWCGGFGRDRPQRPGPGARGSPRPPLELLPLSRRQGGLGRTDNGAHTRLTGQTRIPPLAPPPRWPPAHHSGPQSPGHPPHTRNRPEIGSW
jgi:hypothetical protein